LDRDARLHRRRDAVGDVGGDGVCAGRELGAGRTPAAEYLARLVAADRAWPDCAGGGARLDRLWRGTAADRGVDDLALDAAALGSGAVLGVFRRGTGTARAGRRGAHSVRRLYGAARASVMQRAQEARDFGVAARRGGIDDLGAADEIFQRHRAHA